MKYALATSIVLLAFAFTFSQNKKGFKVEHRGELKNIMHKGDISAQADLNDFKDLEHIYALGAVENLKGEILVLDGQAFISSVQDEQLVLDGSFDHKATLLVYAAVSNWNSIDIPNKISTYEELEQFIEQSANEHGIDTEEPFPFLIKGTPASFDWHVIDWPEGDAKHSHQKHVDSGLNGTVEHKAVEILGFYSKHHHAIFTHHTTNMHLHVKTTDNSISGHLDGIELGKGMTLKLPAIVH